MLKRVTITNYRGESIEYKIEGVDPNNETGVIITDISGLGPTKADINMIELTTMDGGLYNSARAGSRNIVIRAQFTKAESVEDARLLSYKYFPIKRPITFRIETDSRIAETTGYVESNEPVIFSDKNTMQISIICESAYFKDMSESGSTRVSFSAIQPMFRFRYKNDPADQKTTIFGSIVSLRENLVEYNGDAETGIIMRINTIGEAENVEIFNVDTGESMKLNTSRLAGIIPNTSTNGTPNNTKLIYGDEIVINTLQGKKSIYMIRNGIKYNVLNMLDKNPSWFKLAKGKNMFVYRADYGEECIQFSISAQNLFEGV